MKINPVFKDASYDARNAHQIETIDQLIEALQNVKRDREARGLDPNMLLTVATFESSSFANCVSFVNRLCAHSYDDAENVVYKFNLINNDFIRK